MNRVGVENLAKTTTFCNFFENYWNGTYFKTI